MYGEPKPKWLTFFKIKKVSGFYIAFFMLMYWLLPSLIYAQGNLEKYSHDAFEVDTFSSNTDDFRKAVPALQKTKNIDAEALFQKVLKCFPSRSKFNISVKLKGRYGWQDDQFSDLSDLGRYYVGIVAEMPLLDGSEALDRQRKREYDRRKDTAEAVAKFIQGLAKRNQIERQIGLYTALEKRAQTRVQMGIASISEQVGNLKDVIKAQENLESTRAEILQTRLALSGQCSDKKIEAMNTHLRGLAKNSGEIE